MGSALLDCVIDAVSETDRVPVSDADPDRLDVDVSDED